MTKDVLIKKIKDISVIRLEKRSLFYSQDSKPEKNKLAESNQKQLEK